MKAIPVATIERTTSLNLSDVIFFWKEYDTHAVVMAYEGLFKRSHPISVNFHDK